MLSEEVDTLLKGYRENQGRCAHLQTQVRKLERQIMDAEADAREDILYGSHSQFAEKPSTGELVWLPKGNTTGDPTGSAAVRLADGASKEAQGLKIMLCDTKRSLERALELVAFVDAWLKGLSERERWIIVEQVIDGKFWAEVIDGYAEKYGPEFSKEALKYIKSNAMQKIYRMAE